MRDLHSHIVKQYAVHWERLGLELGLKDYHIANISANNARHPRRVEECCIAVLEQWLREIPSPTWSTLDRVIKKITSSVSTDKGGSHGYKLLINCYYYYYHEFIINLFTYYELVLFYFMKTCYYIVCMQLYKICA